MPPGHPTHASSPVPTNSGHSPPPNHNYHKDERAQQQYMKLQKKWNHRQQKCIAGGGGDTGSNATATSNLVSSKKDLVNGLRRAAVTKEKGMNSVGTSEDGEESGSVQDEEDSVQLITDVLSSVQAPKVLVLLL